MNDLDTIVDETRLSRLIGKDTLYLIEITWTTKHPTRVLISSDQIGNTWDGWIGNYLTQAGARPRWFALGDLVFYSQNVVSIELIESIDQEG